MQLYNYNHYNCEAVMMEKLTVAHLFKKFPTLYKTQSFIYHVHRSLPLVSNQMNPVLHICACSLLYNTSMHCVKNFIPSIFFSNIWVQPLPELEEKLWETTFWTL